MRRARDEGEAVPRPATCGERADVPVAPPPGAPLLQEQLRSDLQRLAARFPVFDPARFSALGLTVVAHLPAARREDRALAGMLSLWIIAFDALVDEGTTDEAALAALATYYADLVDARDARRAAGRSGIPGLLAGALSEIDLRLAAYEPAPALWAWWRAALRATIAAIVRQRELGRAQASVPGYAAILPLLLDSIGVRPYLAAGAIIGRERGLTERLPALRALADECALAIRLANDLRTWEKDEREHGVNTLVALRLELARDAPAAPSADIHERALVLLRARLAASHARCQSLAAAPGATGEPGAAMARLEATTVGIYATHDYHTFRADDATGG